MRNSIILNSIIFGAILILFILLLSHKSDPKEKEKTQMNDVIEKKNDSKSPIETKIISRDGKSPIETKIISRDGMRYMIVISEKNIEVVNLTKDNEAIDFYKANTTDL